MTGVTPAMRFACSAFVRDADAHHEHGVARAMENALHVDSFPASYTPAALALSRDLIVTVATRDLLNGIEAALVAADEIRALMDAHEWFAFSRNRKG